MIENPYMEKDGRQKFTIDAPDIAFDKGAKAQLKKMVDMIVAARLHNAVYDDSIPVFFTKEQWQSLLGVTR